MLPTNRDADANKFRIVRLSLGILTALFIASFSSIAYGQISHLEIGAANYSGKTSEKRFFVLESTLTDLIHRFGPTGVVYLNDIDTKGLNEAVAHANSWLDARGLKEIQIVALPGDSNSIEVPKVKTANLTNPGRSQLPGVEFGLEASIKTVEALETIAQKSETGLRISTYFWDGISSGMRILDSMVSEDSSLYRSNKKGLPYYYDDGKHSSQVPGSANVPATRVFYLVSRTLINQPRKCERIFRNRNKAEEIFRRLTPARMNISGYQ